MIDEYEAKIIAELIGGQMIDKSRIDGNYIIRITNRAKFNESYYNLYIDYIKLSIVSALEDHIPTINNTIPMKKKKDLIVKVNDVDKHMINIFSREKKLKRILGEAQ